MINIVVLILVIVIALISYMGFRDSAFFNRFKFEISPITVQKQYYRLITSGFLHADWIHLGFNLITLYFFGNSPNLNVLNFSIIYISSLIFGNLLALYIHRHHYDYSAIGASGAISGIVFSYILNNPTSTILIFFFPLPTWAYGILFLVISIVGIRNQSSNIGHEAHLGGALAGLVTTVILNPKVLIEHYFIFSILFIPTIVFLLIIYKKPEILLLPQSPYRIKKSKTPRQKHRQLTTELSPEEELNTLLDKINDKGYNSLTNAEKKRLKELSGD